MQQQLLEFRERILQAVQQKSALCIQGGGSKKWYGQTVQGELLDTRMYRGVVDYEPSELMLRVRCGTPLQEVEAMLAQQQQMLAFEPPHFGDAATVGGMFAAGLSGPRRVQAGALRDYVLGCEILNGRGEHLRFGGQVMKNVAGYDVSRLMAGSLGVLGLILEVSLKVMPRPPSELSLVLACSETDAIANLNVWTGKALPISASSWHVGRLMLRLSGSEVAVRQARQIIGGDVLQESLSNSLQNSLSPWQALREQQEEFFSLEPEHGLWRIALPSTAGVLRLNSKILHEWHGMQRWLYCDYPADVIRAEAQRLGGSATLFRGGDKATGVFTALSPSLARVHERLKLAFDPARIFNPGRMYSEF
jgi:glycolate oxidase FAD binding subunit